MGVVEVEMVKRGGRRGVVGGEGEGKGYADGVKWGPVGSGPVG